MQFLSYSLSNLKYHQNSHFTVMSKLQLLLFDRNDHQHRDFCPSVRQSWYLSLTLWVRKCPSPNYLCCFQPRGQMDCDYSQLWLFLDPPIWNCLHEPLSLVKLSDQRPFNLRMLVLLIVQLIHSSFASASLWAFRFLTVFNPTIIWNPLLISFQFDVAVPTALF